MTRIPLTKGYATLVDDDDARRVTDYKWGAMVAHSGLVYAQRTVGRGVLLHRWLMDAPNGVQIDHKNGNGLDNRRANLRFATSTENARNRRIDASNNTSGYKGVDWKIQNQKWRAQIRLSGLKLHLGYFENRAEAVKAYDLAALLFFGQFARPNSRNEIAA